MFSLYPRGGKTYLPMPESGSRVFTMSTMDTTGLKPGQIGFKGCNHAWRCQCRRVMGECWGKSDSDYCNS